MKEPTKKEMAIAVVKEGIIRPAILSNYIFINTWHKLLFGTDICNTGIRYVNDYKRMRYDEAVRKIKNGGDICEEEK